MRWGHFIKYSKYVCPALGLKVSTAMSVYLWKRALSSKFDTLDFSRPGKTIKNITQDRKTKNLIFLKVCKTALLSWIGHQKFLDSVYKSLMINILEPFLCLRNLSLFYIMYTNDQIVPLWTFLFFYSVFNKFHFEPKFLFFLQILIIFLEKKIILNSNFIFDLNSILKIEFLLDRISILNPNTIFGPNFILKQNFICIHIW